MQDPRALRNKRLINEGKELMKINGPVIEIIPVGSEPYDTYKIIYHVRTIIGPGPRHRNQTRCTLTIPPNYPAGAPTIVADDKPYPYHINWFQSGRWCCGGWNHEESLVNFISRCAKTLQFDPDIANLRSVANYDAVPFWNANKNDRRYIPSDTQVLPTLDTPVVITILGGSAINPAPAPQPAPVPEIIFLTPQEKLKITFLNNDRD